MKKTIVTLLLAAMSTGAMAEWVKLGETYEAVFYVDSDTIRKNGNFSRMWEIQDLKQRGKSGEMSQRLLSEYDCKEERSRVIYSSLHFESMAKGRMFTSDSTPTEWDYVPPRTAAALMLKMVCGK